MNLMLRAARVLILVLFSCIVVAFFQGLGPRTDSLSARTYYYTFQMDSLVNSRPALDQTDAPTPGPIWIRKGGDTLLAQPKADSIQVFWETLRGPDSSAVEFRILEEGQTRFHRTLTPAGLGEVIGLLPPISVDDAQLAAWLPEQQACLFTCRVYDRDSFECRPAFWLVNTWGDILAQGIGETRHAQARPSVDGRWLLTGRGWYDTASGQLHTWGGLPALRAQWLNDSAFVAMFPPEADTLAAVINTRGERLLALHMDATEEPMYYLQDAAHGITAFFTPLLGELIVFEADRLTRPRHYNLFEERRFEEPQPPRRPVLYCQDEAQKDYIFYFDQENNLRGFYTNESEYWTLFP